MCFNSEFREPYVLIKVQNCRNSSNSEYSAKTLSRWRRYSRIGGGFHLESVHRLASVRVHELVAGIVSHRLHLLFIRLVRAKSERKAPGPKSPETRASFSSLSVLIFCRERADIQKGKRIIWKKRQKKNSPFGLRKKSYKTK